MKKSFDHGKIALYLAIILSVVAVVFSIYTVIAPVKQAPSQVQMPAKMSRMSLTPFDAELAKQLMDKDNDGRCDYCGMPVDICISGGQLECSMNPDAKIGVLGSQHIHANFSLFLGGIQQDLSKYALMHENAMKGSEKLTSSFMHLHTEKYPAETGKVLHMHATGVPLSLFFKSIGMDFEGRKAVVTVNGNKSDDGLNYVFSDGDKVEVAVQP